MKLNKILMALSAMAIVGCSSEDFNDPSATQAINDSRLIELNENFVLAGVGEVDNTMRTHWDREGSSLVNVFLPIYNTAPSNGQTLSETDYIKQAVGLCWLGNGGVGTDVYTNYEFYHFGWLNKEETKANIECDKLTNGAFYSDISLNDDDAIGEADPAKFDITSSGDPAEDVLNFNSGVYKTENKAIFGGQYIVYYPYNENFKDAGTIPAVAQTSFDWINELESTTLGQETFRYSAPVTIKGGDKAADFGLKNLSTLVRLRVSTVADDASIDKEIDQIVLYSESGKLLQQANLAADKIAAGEEGDKLYAETKGTKTITTKFIGATAPKLKVGNATEVKPYITVLPTTVDDLVVLVHNKSLKMWAKVEMPATEFKAGNAQVLDVIVKAADFKSDFIAVDDASLRAAIGEARTALGTSTTAKKEITVIGDIELTGGLDINAIDLNGTTGDNSVKDTQITIKGDDIIVPEDMTLTLATNMESKVRVLGKYCCSGGTDGGKLVVEGGTISDVTMEKTEATNPDGTDNPTLTYNGAATVAAGKTIDVKAGKVEVNAAVAHKGNIKIAEGATVTVNGVSGDLNFMGSTVTNDGTIEVKADGNFDMTDANGNATADDGKRMTNNGTFIHNVDAGVGTAVQKMNQNGEYRCRVNEQIKLDDAFLQWTACSVIEMVDAGTNYNLGTAKGISYKHNGKYIDIEVNTTSGTTFNNPVVSEGNGDSEEIKIGNLTVTAGGLNIDYVQGTGKRTLTVNGDMAVKANTTIVDSKLIEVKGNVTVEGDGVHEASTVSLDYKGGKKNDRFKVAGDITVSGATFKAGNIAGTDAADVDALNITCANFYLKKIGNIGGVAEFANRTDGSAKNMVVSGTIDNPSGCTFNIRAAGQYNNSVLAWVTCTELKVGGSFPNSKPRVE